MLVSASGLTKRFSGTDGVHELNFELRAGEVVGLVGPNGAGKTTTLKLLLGVLRPSAGQAHILGFDCRRDSLRVKECVGYTPDEPHFYDFLTGRETIDFAISVRNLDPEPAWSLLRESIERFQFSPQLDALTTSYSHGAKKKLALLCALAHRPAVLLFDEPTNGLDPNSATYVRQLLRRHAQAGGGALVSTHLLDMAEQICDRLLVIDRGRTVACGTPAELRAKAAVSANATLETAFSRLVAS